LAQLTGRVLPRLGTRFGLCTRDTNLLPSELDLGRRRAHVPRPTSDVGGFVYIQHRRSDQR
jgi:hypothetical protein